MPNKRQTKEQLSQFESHDYVKRFYSRKHNRELNSQRTKEITSCFVQAREYFDSADKSADSVRPLLLYYGVLSLSRGVIIINNSRKNEESLKSSHGLEVVDWRQTLARGINNVLDIGIRVTDGTFTELIDATKNYQDTAWLTYPDLDFGYYTVKFPIPTFVTAPYVLSLDDLISRDRRFLALYTNSTGRRSKTHFGEIVHIGDGSADISIYALEGLTDTTLNSAFNLPGNPQFARRNGSTRIQQLPIFYCRVEAANPIELQNYLPSFSYNHENKSMIIAEDFPNGDKMSELIRTFMLSYIMGMLVRYFPSRWVSLMRNEVGDQAQPVLLSAIGAIQNDFPELALRAVHL